MARAKKEEVELTEETKRIGGWANGLRIVCNILKVFTIIGIVCLALVMLFLPAMMKEVKIDDEKIEEIKTQINRIKELLDKYED